jgi:hypothetical protein
MVEKNKPVSENIFGETAPKITDTPEFKAAVQEAAAAAVAIAMAALKESNPASNMQEDLFRQMALNIAEMTHQGSKKDKPLDPRIIALRAAAQERLDTLLLETREKVHAAREATYKDENTRQAAIRRLMPKYTCVSKVMLDDRVINPFRRNPATKAAESVEFYWLQEPNHAMRPLNEAARKIFAEFRESRGERSKIEKAAVKPLWMTDNGLIIEGANAPQRREVAIPSDLDMPEAKDPEAPYVAVLGTIHEPAQNNYQGKPL